MADPYKRGRSPVVTHTSYANNPFGEEVFDFNLLHDYTQPEAGTNLVNPLQMVDPMDYRRTKRGQQQYHHDLELAKYDAELNLMMYQNEYNSPAAQAKRMREAGMNPELMGLQGTPSATTSGSVGTPAPLPQDTPMSIGKGVIDTVLNLTDATMRGYFGFQSQMEDLDHKRLTNLQESLNLVPAIGNQLAVGYSTDDPEYNSMRQFAQDLMQHIPRKYRGHVAQYMDSYLYSKPFQTKSFKSDSEYLQARMDNILKNNSPMYSGSIEELTKALKPLAEAEFTITKLKNSNDIVRTLGEAKYLDNYDFGGQALTENAVNESTREDAKIKGTLRSAVSECLDIIKPALDRGELWAYALLTSLYTLVDTNMASQISSGASALANLAK